MDHAVHGGLPTTLAAMSERNDDRWPAIPWQPWKETHAALHLWAQIAGKYRLAREPWLNHSWHATLYVTPRGLTTGPVPDGAQLVSVSFDLCDHALIVESGCSQRRSFALAPMSVAQFHALFGEALAGGGATTAFYGLPNELPDPVPFVEDREHRPYDKDAVTRYHRAQSSVWKVLSHFRTSFLGKVSPVHVFWGALDLAVTRFSGRRAPLHPGGVPHLPDDVSREAYSHEVSSAGFWPGGAGVDEPMFYSYAYPAPEGFADARVAPDAAYFHKDLGEFVLPYEALRTARNPEAELFAFLESTYAVTADLGRWDRAELECERGVPLRPRRV